MIVLLDTDILIDVALDRRPFSEPAGQLLDALQGRPGEAYIAWHSVSNFFYLVKPSKGPAETRHFMEDLLRFVRVSPTDTKDALYALRLPMSDVEDALQSAAAIAARVDVIATRNVKDYRNSPVPARSPQAVLRVLGGRSEEEQSSSADPS